MWLKLFARALNLKEILDTVIFKRILVIDSWGISCQIALIWMPLDFIDDQSTLVHIDQLKTKRHHDANFGLQWRQSWHHYNSDHIVAFALGTEYHINFRKQMFNERIA